MSTKDWEQRLANSKRQRQRIMDAASTMPYLMLDVVNVAKAKPECAAMDGKARRVDDPYWEAHFPPCERLDCLCRVIQMGKRQLERNSVPLITPHRS